MRRLRAAADRGHSGDAGASGRCAFSSGDFRDPSWSGFGPLRVLNELGLAPATSPAHPRANMEELGYVLAGSLDAVDVHSGASTSLGTGGVYWIGAGHGAGSAPRQWRAGPQGARLLQAWIQPDRVNAAPVDAWRQSQAAPPGTWVCLAAADGEGGALPIRQQAALYALSMLPGTPASRILDASRRYWLQAVAGALTVDGVALAAGDGLVVTGEAGVLALEAVAAGATLLLFDLPG